MQSNNVRREGFFQGQHGHTPHAWHFAWKKAISIMYNTDVAMEPEKKII